MKKEESGELPEGDVDVAVEAPYIDVDMPEGNFNTQHTFISSKSELADRIGDYRIIYSD